MKTTYINRKAIRSSISLFFAGLIVVGSLLASGCNTMKGVGRDVEAAGDAIEDAAD